MIRSLVVLLICTTSTALAQTNVYDVVIEGGRVMDPESGLDGVRNVGIRNGKVAIITGRPLKGTRTIDAKNLVVAPGFIDLHSHGINNASNEYQMHDGVTTALELEAGLPSVAGYLKTREGKALIHYGTTVAHASARVKAMKEFAAKLGPDTNAPMSGIPLAGRKREDPGRRGIQPDGIPHGARLEGGWTGIGSDPGVSSRGDAGRDFSCVSDGGTVEGSVYTHVRGRGEEGVQEAIANAAGSGASVHIVHLNSSSRGALPVTLEMIAGARKRGIDITTEAYPYTAGSTFIESAIFDDGWMEAQQSTYSDLQWQETGERLTKETFEKYRKQGGIVIQHSMRPEWIKMAMASPFVIVASDGMPYAKGAHPRGGGTFSKVLGEYVRELKATTLMEALRRMTLLPAQRLEPMAPQMKNKGRIRVGADADITVFDPETVKDTGTYETGPQFSRGIAEVIVNGVSVVSGGKTVANVFPGKAVVGNYGARK